MDTRRLNTNIFVLHTINLVINEESQHAVPKYIHINLKKPKLVAKCFKHLSK